MKTGKHSKDNESGEKTHEGHAHKKSSKSLMADTSKLYLVFSLVAMAVLLGVIIYLLAKNSSTVPGSAATGGNSNFKGAKVPVEFYVMSQCPYGTQVEDAIAPVLKTLDGGVDMQLHYIASETTPGSFQSLHGPKEVAGNIVQLCAAKYEPDKYFDMIVCQNKNAANVDTNWEACAKGLGMDTGKISTCISTEGAGLLRTSIQASTAKGASASPTIYIGGQPYNGARDAISFQRAICQYSDHPSCGDIPKCAADTDCNEQAGKDGYCLNAGQKEATCEYKDPVAVDVIVLNQDTCSSCDTTRIVQVTQQLFLGSKTRNVDVDSEEGKALVAKYGIELLPAYIFDASVKDTKSWKTTPDLAGVFDTESDGKYTLKPDVVGATYFVSEEARQAHYDSVGVVKNDNKPQIDFFVMSYCPYGNQAEEGIAPVQQLLKAKAEFKPHYVIYGNYQGGGAQYCAANGELCSMHGIQELHQNMREACVLRDDGVDKWFAFALAMNEKCTAQNADTCWTQVAKDLGFDTAKIAACESKDGEALMRADKELGDKLGVQGSPTIFVDGDSYNGGRDPEAYKTGLCAAFENQPTECSTKLEGSANPATAAAMAAGCGV